MQRTWLQTQTPARATFQELAEEVETQLEASPNRWQKLGWETRYAPLHLMFQEQYWVPEQLVPLFRHLPQWKQQMLTRYLMCLIEDQRLPELNWGTEMSIEQIQLVKKGLQELETMPPLEKWQVLQLETLPPVELHLQQD